jgi:hypothetical protein
MIRVQTTGSFSKTIDFLNRMKRREQFKVLQKYGAMGVAALKEATPRDDGDTAQGWYYEIVEKPGYFAIHWLNSAHVPGGKTPIAVLIQYGHATRQGGYVEGFDFVNPAMRPIFDQMAADMWKEVTR